MSQAQSEKRASYWTLLFVLCVVYVLINVVRVCIHALGGDIAHSLQISETQVSLLASAVLMGYGFMQIPAGLLTDALGGRRTIALFLVLGGLSTIAVGLMPSLGIGVGARFITGMAISMIPPCVALLAVAVPSDQFAKAMGLFLACGAVGLMLAGAPLVMLNKALGWRTTLVAFGAASFVLLVVVLRLTNAPAKDEASAQKPAFSWAALGKGLMEVFRTKEFWPLALWQMLMPGTLFIFAARWWTQYLSGTGGFGMETAGHIYTFQALLAMVLGPIISTFSDKIHSRKKILVALSTLAVLASVSQVFLAGKLPPALLAVQALAFGLGTAGGAACLLTSVKETFPHHLAGTATGCVNMFYPIFAAVMTPVFGALYERKAATMIGAAPELIKVSSYAYACWLLVGFCALGLICSLLIKESYAGKASH